MKVQIKIFLTICAGAKPFSFDDDTLHLFNLQDRETRKNSTPISSIEV